MNMITFVELYSCTARPGSGRGMRFVPYVGAVFGVVIGMGMET